jgi:hypothetical protein
MSAKTATTTNLVKTSGEGKVIGEALIRAGKNPHLKGHIHEVLIKDSINLNPVRVLNGESARLTASNTAKTVDIVVSKGGKVIERIQAKDTVGSMGKTINQIKNGQYNSAQIVGTKETAAEFGKHAGKLKGAKSIKSSGFSSNYTESLAQRAGANGSGTLSKALGASAKTGAQVGGVVCGGIAVAKGVCDLLDGSKDVGEVAYTVAKETAGGAISGAAAGAAATAAGAGTAMAVTALGVTGFAATATVVVAPVVAAVAVGYVAKEAWDFATSDEVLGNVKDSLVDVGIETVECVGSAIDDSICGVGRSIDSFVMCVGPRIFGSWW